MTLKYTVQDIERLLKNIPDQSEGMEEYGPNCLTADLLDRFVRGQVSEEEQQSVLAHIATCSTCIHDISFLLMDNERSRSAEPQVFLNGQLLGELKHHWYEPERRVQIRTFRTSGHYLIRWGDLTVEFDCTEDDLVRPLQENDLRRAAASEKGLDEKKNSSPGGRLCVTLQPGALGSRFMVERENL
jgi:hypothetical protein